MTGLAGTALLANGNSSSRGRYSPQVQKAIEYLLNCSTASGLITGPTIESWLKSLPKGGASDQPVSLFDGAAVWNAWTILRAMELFIGDPPV